MRLLYISTFMFLKQSKKTLAIPSCSDLFFEKYLDVFDSVHVLGEEIKAYLDKSALVEMKNKNIDVRILPANTKPQDFKNDAIVKKALTEEIKNAEAILIKPATRRGIMAIKIAEKLKKPYMIEMTGDIHNALKQNPNILKRFYAPILYHKIKNAIKNAPYGLYVSKDYLQSQFPIKGKMCGCSDVVLEKADDSVLEKRFDKINNLKNQKTVSLALVGFYQGKMKGVDTAIRALSQLPEKYNLYILGNGTEENRNKWIEYGKKLGVINRIHFPKPLSSAKEVLNWIDTVDIFVLPTRSEGLSRSVAEAMSRGCLCFATDICTMPELLPKECLHPLGDDRTLAKQIEETVSNPNKARKYAEINFEHAKDYDYELLRKKRNSFLTEFRDYCEECGK